MQEPIKLKRRLRRYARIKCRYLACLYIYLSYQVKEGISDIGDQCIWVQLMIKDLTCPPKQRNAKTIWKAYNILAKNSSLLPNFQAFARNFLVLRRLRTLKSSVNLRVGQHA